jgi:hypothetical protein
MIMIVVVGVVITGFLPPGTSFEPVVHSITQASSFRL